MISPHPLREKLYVITVVSNPVRYLSRYALYRQFKKHCEESGAQLFTVEIAFGDRPHEVTTADNPMNLQLRSWDEIWHKENMVNLGIKKLCQVDPGAEYIAWVDADISFVRKDWVEETIQQLQHYMFVQMFQDAIDLGPKTEVIQLHKGFMYSWMNGKPFGQHYEFWHPGYAWAARREALDQVGLLMDRAILGAADHHMALAMVGKVRSSFPGNIHPNYMRMCLKWQEMCDRFIKQDVGYVPGAILHYFHGKKKDRRYRERWEILIKNGYDPDADLRVDSQGLYHIGDLKPQLRNDIRAYFRQRNEDSVDAE